MDSIDVRVIKNAEDIEKFLVDYHISKYPQLRERTFNLDIYGFMHISKIIHTCVDSMKSVERIIVNTDIPSPVPGPNYIKLSMMGYMFTFVHDKILDKKYSDNEYQLKNLYNMTLTEAVKLGTKYNTLLNKWGINTPLRRAHFFAQIYHESNFNFSLAENMNYSAKRLREVFPKYFTVAEANQFAGKPEAIGNKVYGNRMGNGPTEGYKYRGRSGIQLTGKDNYKALTKESGVDYVNNPDLLLTEADGMIAACWYWKTNNINKYTDIDDLDGVSDLVNIGKKTAKYGDANGFKDRLEKLQFFKKQFKVK